MTTEEKKIDCPCGCHYGVIGLNFDDEYGTYCAKCMDIHRNTPPETGREWEKEFSRLIGKSVIEANKSIQNMEGGVWTTLEGKHIRAIKSFIRSIESSALAQGEKIGAEKERERIRTKIVAYAIEGRFDADEIKGLSLYSKIIRYFDALKGTP